MLLPLHGLVMRMLSLPPRLLCPALWLVVQSGVASVL